MSVADRSTDYVDTTYIKTIEDGLNNKRTLIKSSIAHTLQTKKEISPREQRIILAPIVNDQKHFTIEQWNSVKDMVSAIFLILVSECIKENDTIALQQERNHSSRTEESHSPMLSYQQYRDSQSDSSSDSDSG